MFYTIDGLFLTQKITGIQRFAFEICKELDKISDKNEFEILVPENCNLTPDFKNIRITKFGKHSGRFWEQIDLKKYLKKNKNKGIFLTNELPLLYRKGFVCIHDISYKVNPLFFVTLKDHISSLWHRINYFAAFNSDMEILTVSEFSKKEIERIYSVDQERITVIYNSWQHMNEIKEDLKVFDNNKKLKKLNYFFSMSTIAANKNFKWILYAAEKNPEFIFAIAGGGNLKMVAEEMGFLDLQNVIFLGYVTDEEAKALMHYCKAFLFPTFYEGFGIPPLEAASCGCDGLVVSNIPVMHEIYGEYANYVDPYDYENITINAIINSKDIDGLLDSYSWKRSAKILYDKIKEKEDFEQ